jgi:hypothetical protein
MPALMDENIEAWALWIEVQTQWRAGAMGVIGLDYHAVYREAERLAIDLSAGLMKKIKRLERSVLEQINDHK